VCCVWCSLLSETLSWNVVKVACEVSLFMEWVNVIGWLFCDWSIALAVYLYVHKAIPSSSFIYLYCMVVKFLMCRFPYHIHVYCLVYV
jgi:hypothetical protein